jgi:F-type H+-transporting ATPase subunit a
VASPKKRKLLGCSLPVLVAIIIIFLVITVMGFLAGPLGQALFGEISWLKWMAVERPSPHLPAPVLFHLFRLPVTNTILAGWITVIFLVLLSWLITRRMKLIPGRLQAAFEALAGWVYDLCRSTAGEENGRRFFPVVGTIFLFVAFNAWLSLIPGYGSILLGDHELLRGSNTDINTPLAIAIISFVFVAYYGLKMLGVKWLHQYFDFGPLFRSFGNTFKGKFNVLDIFIGAIGVVVGFLELFSRFITIISFTFRLFGNMTAGEILLLVTAYLIPWVLALPFYGLELLIGFIQGLIFAGLTLVFATMAVTSHQEEAHQITK